ncbi:MAG: NUDIX domain protein [halophilic archaeon J07HX64]|jgi:NUDIX domain.|nr:MAG: NUDIX domain protein [halophilic archaeon J07HX64]
MPDIRVVALGAVQRRNELLVQEMESPETGDLFYRLLGGGVECGEHSREAVVREFDEELAVELVNPTQIGTFERVFSYDGETGHEIWRVYEGQLREAWPYEQESFTFVEPELGTEHLARWMPVERLQDDNTTFYAPEVLDALEL